MKKAFCDNCGREITTSQGVQMIEIKTVLWVKERSSATSARDSNMDFCDALCFGRGMEKWMEKVMQNLRKS
jgi:hypothetical protein